MKKAYLDINANIEAYPQIEMYICKFHPLCVQREQVLQMCAHFKLTPIYK